MQHASYMFFRFDFIVYTPNEIRDPNTCRIITSHLVAWNTCRTVIKLG